MRMFAQVTESGTAMAETAYCEACLPNNAADYPVVYDDCTGNEALSCNDCGKSVQPRTFFIRETSLYRVSANSPEEAWKAFYDAPDVAAYHTVIEDMSMTDENGNDCPEPEATL